MLQSQTTWNGRKFIDRLWCRVHPLPLKGAAHGEEERPRRERRKMTPEKKRKKSGRNNGTSEKLCMEEQPGQGAENRTMSKEKRIKSSGA